MTTPEVVESNSAEILREVNARLEKVCGHAVVEAAERAWSTELWASLEADGFATVGRPESFGGSGGTVADCCAVLQAAGYHAAPLPLAESGLLAGWFTTVLGAALPEGVFSVAPSADLHVVNGGAALSGTASRVPWGRYSDHIGVLVGGENPMVAVLDRRSVEVRESTNFAGEPRDDITVDGVVPLALAPLSDGHRADELRELGALSRAAMAAGAVERLADLTVRYTSERKQFGKAVGSFQAVQVHIVAVAEMTALLKVAVSVAAAAVDAGGGEYEIAASKVMASRATTIGTRAAHQAHGAMGMTREYPLHHSSRRLWSWNAEYGDERSWSDVLGQKVLAVGADGLYPFLTAPRTHATAG